MLHILCSTFEFVAERKWVSLLADHCYTKYFWRKSGAQLCTSSVGAGFDPDLNMILLFHSKFDTNILSFEWAVPGSYHTWLPELHTVPVDEVHHGMMENQGKFYCPQGTIEQKTVCGILHQFKINPLFRVLVWIDILHNEVRMRNPLCYRLYGCYLLHHCLYKNCAQNPLPTSRLCAAGELAGPETVHVFNTPATAQAQNSSQ